MGEILLEGHMPNVGGAALTGVWMFNWEETYRQVRSDMLWYPIPVVLKAFSSVGQVVICWFHFGFCMLHL
jgi:hypothetical protein